MNCEFEWVSMITLEDTWQHPYFCFDFTLKIQRRIESANESV